MVIEWEGQGSQKPKITLQKLERYHIEELWNEKFNVIQKVHIEKKFNLLDYCISVQNQLESLIPEQYAIKHALSEEVRLYYMFGFKFFMISFISRTPFHEKNCSKNSEKCYKKSTKNQIVWTI